MSNPGMTKLLARVRPDISSRALDKWYEQSGIPPPSATTGHDCRDTISPYDGLAENQASEIQSLLSQDNDVQTILNAIQTEFSEG